VKVRTAQDGVNDGEISAISVRNGAGKEEPVDGLDGLRRHLVLLREVSDNKDDVRVEAEGTLRVRNLTKVMDACRQAGFKNVKMTGP
jgi:biopolymer transport protein ExbD